MWLEKIAEAEGERRGYLRLATNGRMTDEELDTELAAIEKRRERLELLERDKDEILNSYARMAPEALGLLSPEERCRLYRMLRLKVIATSDRSLEVSGALETGVVKQEMVLR